MNINLTEAQLSLQRSPAHLRNMVKKIWTRVGLGIAQNARGYFYLTQEFSSRDLQRYPLTTQELSQIKNDVIKYIQ